VLRRLGSKLTYANVMATIAVFIALGSASYAAIKLPKNSVGTEQLKKGAVTATKLSKTARATLAADADSQGKEGARGAEGAPGKNAIGAAPLAPETTETGVFAAAAGSETTVAGQLLTAVVQFPQPLPAPLDAHHVITLKQTESSADHCPGEGRAAPGYFCAYVAYEQGASFFSPFENPGTGGNGTGVDGANAFAKTTGTGTGAIAGTWAVTAP
jgi:hypothetical protein